MYKTRKPGATDGGENTQLYVEMDPTQRYGRFKDILGKGAMKVVYRAFDEFLGIEVAWNQVKLNDVFKSPEELQRLYCEVHLLKNLNHTSIMQFRASWTDVDRRTFNFITEMFSSGTLREYRKKYKRVNVRAIKNWARQILEGLEYMHGHDPPVIHRDLKCDNIFVNGHLGQVKIGDLGLAAMLRGSQRAHSVIGTPEFMAPEMYEEEYDELVDIYSFGMCILEMLTCEYPYSECSNPAQIYKKVTSGKLPAAFYQIDDESRRFIGRCLEKADHRPSARELLMDPFLSIEEEVEEELPAAKVGLQKTALIGKSPELRRPERRTNMMITGTMNSEEDTIFLKVQIFDKNDSSEAKNIYFPFDITGDASLDVATEMVKELDITDWEPFEIANMIDDEISNLVPSWKYSGYHQIHQQHSFKYAEEEADDDHSFHHPFRSTSSISSSQDSLSVLFTSLNMQTFQGNSPQRWFQDDASSQSSYGPDTHSDVKYFCQGNNEFDHPSSYLQEEPHCIPKPTQCTRFDPDRNVSKNRHHSGALDRKGRQQQKLSRTASVLDLRSKLLHQKLVDEVNKRRLFKTVGSVENIGYHDPGYFS